MDHSLSKASAGFTMTEMVITMAIVAILMAIGVPSFKYVTTSNRLSTEVNGLLGDMQFARSEAIKEGLPVTVCSSLSGTQCDGGNNWQSRLDRVPGFDQSAIRRSIPANKSSACRRRLPPGTPSSPWAPPSVPSPSIGKAMNDHPERHDDNAPTS